eukprot:gene19527-32995_t
MIANLRRLILLAMMAAAFHHPRPATAKSVPDEGGNEGDSVASTPPPSTNNAPPTTTTGSAFTVVTQTESDFATDLEETQATKLVAAHQASSREEQGERDALADVRLRGSDAATTMCTWTGSDWQPLQPSDLPLAEKNPPGQKSAAAEGVKGWSAGDITAASSSNNLQPFVEMESSALPPAAKTASVGMVADAAGGHAGDEKTLGGDAAHAVARLRRADEVDVTAFATLNGDNNGVSSVAFNHDGSILASGSGDDTIKLWRLSNNTLITTLTGHAAGVTSVAFNHDGSVLASGAYDSTIKLWRMSDNRLITTLGKSMNRDPDIGHTRYKVESVAFNHDGSILASGSEDSTIKLWRMSDIQQTYRRLIKTLYPMASFINCVAFNHDGSILASGSTDGTIRLFRMSDIQSGNGWIKTLYHAYMKDTVHSLAFNPDGSILASGSRDYNGNDNTIKLWRMSDKKLIKTLTGHAGWVESVAFNYDGSILASGSGDKTIKLWRMSDNTLIKTLTGHAKYVNSVAFNHDGSILASGSWDNTIKLWRQTCPEEYCSNHGVCFFPGSMRVVGGHLTNTANYTCVCDHPWSGLNCELCNGADPNLTPDPAQDCNGDSYQTLSSHRETVCIAQPLCEPDEYISPANTTQQLYEEARTCTECPDWYYQPSNVTHRISTCEKATVDTCTSAGKFNKETGKCDCLYGYGGDDCSDVAAGCMSLDAALESQLAAEAADNIRKVVPSVVSISAGSVLVAYGYLLKGGGAPNGATSFSDLSLQTHFWAFLSVGLKLFDMQTDWSFFFISLRGEPFESQYKLDANATRRFTQTGRYNADVTAIQMAAFASCAYGTVLTFFDIYGTRQRLGGAVGVATVATLLVMLIEDVPQLAINIIYIKTMATASSAPAAGDATESQNYLENIDAISIISLVASILNLLYSIYLLVSDRCKAAKDPANTFAQVEARLKQGPQEDGGTESEAENGQQGQYTPSDSSFTNPVFSKTAQPKSADQGSASGMDFN